MAALSCPKLKRALSEIDSVNRMSFIFVLIIANGLAMKRIPKGMLYRFCWQTFLFF